ncbi:ArsR/SmtB family transcription factor [Gandjariella thermophila]|uniref:Transcriptional regulator n=1 Tax=Gandjariella thermophila TaxID=1931992 RepID=A0A4D4JBU9_9PSEU|nr:metalloregulator ArsR/SmtB family transcription factor [Gandjariella thermophila]GDY33064.1 transcriptional regulator [Gandjariella thermophila]
MDHEQAAKAVAELARQLSSPARVRILTLLATEGPIRVSEIAAALDMRVTTLSNHLSRLRQTGVVTVSREGRHATYHLASARTQELLGELHAAVGTSLTIRHIGDKIDQNLINARSCYDHLAGKIGVQLFERLLAHRAIDANQETIALGPHAEQTFIALGVGLTALDSRRRKLAFACPDWIEQRHHLGGALGAAVLASLLDRNWLRPLPNTRALQITQAGRKGLAHVLGIPG